MNPDDLIEKGLIRDEDLEGGPPAGAPAELGPFGRYMLLEELGRGGAGIVFRALDPLLNRELALKRLRFGDFELEARFLREAELLARLSHPGIMPVFDFGRESDSLYFTMPLATGMSLERWIVERRPDGRESARIVRQSAEALAHAHERGVLHRDVKPSNILVSAEGNALVADFGLGRVVDPKGREAGRMTASGEVMGTPSYMAPEFASGDLKGVDARCDVYGLGATLYEAMTGRPPFIGKSSLDILKQVTSDEPVPPRRLAPHAPADLEIICLKALEKDPARRYATAGELADDLGRFLAGEPIRARRASPLYRLRRFVGRRWAIVAVALAGLAVAGTILAVGGIKEKAAAERRERVTNFLHEARRQNDNIHLALQRVSETDSEVVTAAYLSLDMIARALQDDPENGEAHYLRGMNHALRFDAMEARRHYDAAIQRGYTRARLERAILDLQDLIAEGSRHRTFADTPGQRTLRSSVVRKLEAILRQPSLPEKDFAEAMVALCERKWGTAAKLLQSYAASTNDWRAHYWHGVAEMEAAWDPLGSSIDRSARAERAQEALEKARRLRSQCKVSARILERLGVAFFQGERNDDAVRCLRESLKQDSNAPDTHYHLANVLLYRFKDHQAAIAEVEIGMNLEADPMNTPAQAHAIRGVAYGERSDEEGLRTARKSLERALELLPPESNPANVLRATLENVMSRLERFAKPPRDY